ncbi:MAG: RNA polymerase factor sigma-32 [Magnetococcales bacterium]|nr:RNA polymerase factor sigma-32 [Magnetococcales bacterium]
MSTNMPIALNRSYELDTVSHDAEFRKFLHRAYHAPLLTAEEEVDLSNRLRQEQDLQAAHELVFSHLRLVIKIAREYLGYRLPLPDLVQEGTLGLMHAVKLFEPERGVRLATYAVWWIRASIHDFVLRSWSIVKIATTQLKRQLFFKLRQMKESAFPMTADEAELLAKKFGTTSSVILEMDGRMVGSDSSLNHAVFDDSGEMLDMIADERPNQEVQILEREKTEVLNGTLHQALQHLDPRERMIVQERFVSGSPKTLEAIGQTLSVSRERVRQLEQRALEKLRVFLMNSPAARDIIVPA